MIELIFLNIIQNGLRGKSFNRKRGLRILLQNPIPDHSRRAINIAIKHFGIRRLDVYLIIFPADHNEIVLPDQLFAIIPPDQPVDQIRPHTHIELKRGVLFLQIYKKIIGRKLGAVLDFVVAYPDSPVKSVERMSPMASSSISFLCKAVAVRHLSVRKSPQGTSKTSSMYSMLLYISAAV